MSDEQNDVVAEVPAVAAEPAAPAEEPAPDTLAAFNASVAALPPVTSEDEPNAEAAPAEEQLEPTPATPVLAATPSSASDTQQPESAPEVEEEPLPLAEAVAVLLVYVKAHRTAGDADLEAAVADVEASLAAQA